MTKTETKKIAKEVLMESIAIAYYKIADNAMGFEDIQDDDKEVIYEYINKYGQVMAKAIKEKYYTL